MDGFISKVGFLYFFYINFIFSNASKIDIIPSSGVILERLPEVYLTSSSWTFVFNFEMDQFNDDTKRVRELSEKLESINTPLSFNYPRFQQEVDKLKSSMKSYLKEAVDLLQFLPAKTSKGRAFDIEGSMWKNLFGLATEHNITDIQIQVNEIKKYSKGTRHLWDKHLSFIAHMEKRIDDNSQYIRDATNDFLTLTSTLQAKILPQYSNLSMHIDNDLMYYLVASHFRELELTISNAKFQLVNLKAAIYSSTVEILNSGLIEPEKMEEMLISLEKNASMMMTFPKIQTLQRYSLARVSAARSPSAFIILVSLPVFTPDSSFDTYLPHTYPVYNKDVESWLELDLERSVLLISHDGMYFNVLPLSDYRSCIHDTMTICLHTHKMRSRNVSHCLLNIYNNSTDLCSYILKEPALKPYIERIQDSVIFSTDSKVILNAVCPPSKFMLLEVEGHGIIRNISYCIVTSGFEKVLPLHIDKIGNISFIPKLDVPSLDWSLPFITNSSEVLTADLDATKDALVSLRNDKSRDNGEVHLSSLISYISEAKQSRSQHRISAITIAIFVSIFIVIVIFCSISKVRRRYQRANEFI